MTCSCSISSSFSILKSASCIRQNRNVVTLRINRLTKARLWADKTPPTLSDFQECLEMTKTEYRCHSFSVYSVKSPHPFDIRTYKNKKMRKCSAEPVQLSHLRSDRPWTQSPFVLLSTSLRVHTLANVVALQLKQTRRFFTECDRRTNGNRPRHHRQSEPPVASLYPNRRGKKKKPLW